MEVTTNFGGIARGSEGPGEDLGIEILADVEGGSVEGFRPEPLLVRPELGLLQWQRTRQI